MDFVAANPGVARQHGSFYRRCGKRALDLGLCVLLAVPVLVALALLYPAVRWDGGPAFFGHARIGRDGRVFRCWKVRTMVPNAQAVLAQHLAADPAAAAEWRRDFKLRDDPRVTRLGARLRRTSLDELPQIWNVLRGEMSFVGPRPITRDEFDRYSGHEWSYLSVKPGITGLWQVSGRNDISYQARVNLDVAYATQCSLLFDLLILAKTATAVLNRTGY
jgi:lipopolysaccharide/colanic/teichoic acid biosynthesis glycosyltransferase